MEKVQIEREFPWDKRTTQVKKENIPLPRSLLLRPRLGSPVPSRSQVELKDAFRLPYKLLSWKTKAIKHTASCHSLMTTTGSQPEDRSPEEMQAEKREMKGSGAPWKLCHMEAIPEEQGGRLRRGVCPAHSPWGRGRASVFQHGRSRSGTEAGALRMELKGVILACSFVRIGSKRSLEKEYCS